MPLQFSVGDKVVHPRHGPVAIAGIERKELLDGPKRYYVLETPDGQLTVYVPVARAENVGLRPAMPRSRLPEVLLMLRARPQLLPEDYRERQEQIEARLRTGRVGQLVQAVRDLTWHERRAHLTKKDRDLLRQGLEQLAAEMALVSGDDVEETGKLVEATIASAMAAQAH